MAGNDLPDYFYKLAITEDIFSKAISTISEYYINKDRDIHMNKMFWYSLFCTKMREYLANMIRLKS